MSKKYTKQSNEVLPAREGFLSLDMPFFVTEETDTEQRLAIKLRVARDLKILRSDKPFWVMEGTDTEQRLAIKLRVVRDLKTLRSSGITPKATDAGIDKAASDFAKTVVLTNIFKSTKG